MGIDFDNIKDKVLGAFGTVADTTRDVAAKTADKVMSTGRIAKLSMEITGEKDAIKKAYVEIGKLYYETHRDDPDGFFVQLCDEVTLAMKSIEEKEAEIAELKAADNQGDIEVEFEEIINEAEYEADCDCCSAEEKLDEVKDKVEDTLERAADKAGDIAENLGEKLDDIKDTVEYKAESIKDAIEDKVEDILD